MERPTYGWKLNKHSFSKLIVRFKDGNIRTFYSIDWKSKKSQYRDREVGLDRLRNLVKKYGPMTKNSEIYDLDSGNIIAKFLEGNEVSIDHNQRKGQ
ncbi:MAG: hypothetical protein R8G66_06525 [Cytophagales bacterium]|nr:hypothetical protein [Cytophagales bacterium]